MQKEIKISYQNRHGPHGDLPTAPKLVIANHILKKYGFSIGDKVTVQYSPGSIIINKINQTL
jgi:hypothetical protein